MARQVAARMKGDDYQIRFFWYRAAEMLYNPIIKKVYLERDDVAVVDDVTVEYSEPGRLLGNENVNTDYFQLKYHIVGDRVLDFNRLMDPTFYNTKQSFLERLFSVNETFDYTEGNHHLYLVTNCSWNPTDKCCYHLKEGSIDQKFFEKGPRSVVGKIKKEIKDHLGIDESELRNFFSRLHFDHSFFSRDNLNIVLNDRLRAAKLQPINQTQLVSKYDELGRKFITEGLKAFTKDDLISICEREELLSCEENSWKTKIGVRSFNRGVKTLDTDCHPCLDLVNFFNGRYIKNSDIWNNQLSESLFNFVNTEVNRQLEEPLSIKFDTHISIGFVMGYLLSPKLGLNIFPWQMDFTKGIQPWICDQYPNTDNLINTVFKHNKSNRELAVYLSITQDVSQDAQQFSHDEDINVSVLSISPSNGIGFKSIENGPHAYAIVNEIEQKIMEKIKENKIVLTHLFISAPIAFVYLFGQRARGLGAIQLYEYDFERRKEGLYFPSIQIPNKYIV